MQCVQLLSVKVLSISVFKYRLIAINVFSKRIVSGFISAVHWFTTWSKLPKLDNAAFLFGYMAVFSVLPQ